MQFVDIKSLFVSQRGNPSNSFHGDTSSASIPSDDDIYINSAYRKIYNAADWPWLEASDETLDTVSGQVEYDMPSTVWTPKVVRVNNIVCYPTTKDQVIMSNNYNATDRSGQPYFYYITGNSSARKIGLHPVPDSNGTNNVEIYGTKPFTRLSADSDEPGFQSTGGFEYIEVLIAGAIYFYVLKDDPDDFNLHKAKLAIFENLLKDMKKDLLDVHNSIYPVAMMPKRIIHSPPEGHIPRTPFP